MTAAGRRRVRTRRSAVLLEFVFTLPLSLIFMMLIVDAGRMYSASGELHEATWRAAAVAGAVGGADVTRNGEVAAEVAFRQALAGNQAGDNLVDAELHVVAGTCPNTDAIIEVVGRASIDSITPGLALLLDGAGGSWEVSTFAVARCEVAP